MRAAQFRLALDAVAKATSRTVFTVGDLTQSVMPHDTPRAIERTLQAAVRDKLLVRVCRGLYAYEYTPRLGRSTREEIVLRLRPRAFNYISLESALSLWGVIDQEALGAITVMSTGRSARFTTPYGLIDITHTERRVAEAMAEIVAPEPRKCWLPYAKPRLAARDLRRVGRNLDLVEWDEIAEVEREMAA